MHCRVYDHSFLFECVYQVPNMFHIPNGVPFGCLLKKKNAPSPFRGFWFGSSSNLRLRVGGDLFVQEGPAFRCPESVALATDFEREGAAVFWVEAEGARRGWWLVQEGDFRVGMLISIYIYIFNNI